MDILNGNRPLALVKLVRNSHTARIMAFFCEETCGSWNIINELLICKRVSATYNCSHTIVVNPS
jgi:hypothetical protein